MISFYIKLCLAVLALIWCAGIIITPVLKNAGHNNEAELLYRIYSKTCHQIDHRSSHIADEKFAVCVRCTGIYFGFFIITLLSLVFGCVKKKRKNIGLDTFISVLVILIIDIFINMLGIYAQDTIRLIIGITFGLVSGRLIVPLLLEACLQLLLKSKKYKGAF